MNVLSLFDGMSCGQIALNRTGVEYHQYFSSEIDKYAINITQKNFPNTIQLGDIGKWRRWDLPDIDIVIGGSPCQGFSFQGKMLNFNDHRSRLFFTFVDILKAIKPKIFLLENVKMKKEYQDVITEVLGVNPVLINSNHFSAQNRVRLYWTNIKIKEYIDRNILLNDVIDHNLPFTNEPYREKFNSNKPIYYKSKKYPTLRAHAGSRTRGIGICNELGYWRKLTPNECELLQTVQIDYTEGVSDAQRYKMLGNGWTIDVISHIFKGLI